MKLWKLDCECEKYEGLLWGEDEYSIDLKLIRSFNGDAKEKNWVPIHLVRLNGYGDFSNCPSLSAHVPVFDKKAIEEMREYLEGNAEILPVYCEDKEFYIINVTRVIDCIDYDASEYTTFSDQKRIMCFKKYMFIKEKIQGIHIFKIKDERLKRPFVSDAFRQKVLDSNLTGFKFKLVWDSEDVMK